MHMATHTILLFKIQYIPKVAVAIIHFCLNMTSNQCLVVKEHNKMRETLVTAIKQAHAVYAMEDLLKARAGLLRNVSFATWAFSKIPTKEPPMYRIHLLQCGWF
jgi:hypothetical protein